MTSVGLNIFILQIRKQTQRSIATNTKSYLNSNQDADQDFSAGLSYYKACVLTTRPVVSSWDRSPTASFSSWTTLRWHCPLQGPHLFSSITQMPLPDEMPANLKKPQHPTTFHFHRAMPRLLAGLLLQICTALLRVTWLSPLLFSSVLFPCAYVPTEPNNSKFSLMFVGF